MGTRIEKMRRKKELHNVKLMQKLGMTHDGSVSTFRKTKSRKKIHKAAQSVISHHGPSISKEDTTLRDRGSNLENIIHQVNNDLNELYLPSLHRNAKASVLNSHQNASTSGLFQRIMESKL